MQVRHHKLGLVLIIASCAMWGVALIVPMLPVSNGASPATILAHKALATTSLVIFSEVVFWLGILLSGKELARRYRQKLNPCYWWQRFTRRRD